MPTKTPEIEIIDDVEQGSEAWKLLRLGLPTASNFSDVLMGGDGKVRGLYMRKLAGEIITGIPREDYRNGSMDRGNAFEPSLRATFQIETGLDLRQISLVKRRRPYGVIGASPDSLIGDDGGVEFKSAAPHILIDILRAGRVPAEHVAQLQGNMLASGRAWWWIAIGYPGMPLFKRKVARDSAYCARLDVALETFFQELTEMVTWLRNYGREP